MVSSISFNLAYFTIIADNLNIGITTDVFIKRNCVFIHEKQLRFSHWYSNEP